VLAVSKVDNPAKADNPDNRKAASPHVVICFKPTCPADSPAKADSPTRADSLAKADSPAKADPADSPARADSPASLAARAPAISDLFRP